VLAATNGSHRQTTPGKKRNHETRKMDIVARFRGGLAAVEQRLRLIRGT
jgi:hypothetical protein